MNLWIYLLHHGRIPRATWLYRILLVAAVCGAFGTLGQSFFGDAGALPFALLFLWCGGALTIQRLHDLTLSAWWLLILVVPLFGPLWLFFLMFRRGVEGRNRYGSEPLSRGDYLRVDISRP